jgi:hypothetical protein
LKDIKGRKRGNSALISIVIFTPKEQKNHSSKKSLSHTKKSEPDHKEREHRKSKQVA